MFGRRSLLLSPLAAVLLPRKNHAAQLASLHGEIYRQLGIRPLINAAGTYTTVTGSLLVPEARVAMNEASKYFVPLIDLQLAAGRGSRSCSVYRPLPSLPAGPAVFCWQPPLALRGRIRRRSSACRIRPA